MKPHDIDYTNLNEALVRCVPEIAEAYEKECEWWGTEKPGPHIVFDDILRPHIVALLKTHRQSSELQRIFDFLELLANHKNIHIQEVVALGVCEGLCEDIVLLKMARKYMGTHTKRFCEDINSWQQPKKPG